MEIALFVIQLVCAIAATAAVIMSLYQQRMLVKLKITLSFIQESSIFSLTGKDILRCISLSIYNNGTRPFHFSQWGIVNNNGITVFLPPDDLCLYYKTFKTTAYQFEKRDLLDTKEHFKETLQFLLDKKLLCEDSDVVLFVDDISGQRMTLNTKKSVNNFLQ